MDSISSGCTRRSRARFATSATIRCCSRRSRRSPSVIASRRGSSLAFAAASCGWWRPMTPRRNCGRAFEPLVFALAHQCFLNEYVWDVTEGEHALVRAIKARVGGAIEAGAPSSADLGILACYEPLAAMPTIGEWCRTGLDRSRASARRSSCARSSTNPRLKRESSRELKQIGEIRDQTSLAVRAQYEENPYPQLAERRQRRTGAPTRPGSCRRSRRSRRRSSPSPTRRAS